MRTMIALCLVMLAGCATTPPEHPESAPTSRVFAFTEPSDAVAVVVRDSGLLGHGCGINVSLDDVRAAFLAAGEKVTLHIAVGDHILRINPSQKGICFVGGKGFERTLGFHVEKGDTPQFRIATYNGIALMQTSF